MATEKYANAASTTLNGNITSIASSLVLTSAATFPANGQFRVLIGTEIIIVGAIAGTTCSSLTRGAENTTAASHTSGDAIVLLLTAGSMTNNPRAMTTTGDTEYLNSSGAPTRLAAPADGYYALKFASSVPSYSTAELAARATKSTAQSISNNTDTPLTFDTNTFDTGSIHATTKFTVPAGAGGIWLINGQVLYATAVATYAYIRIVKNGTTELARNELNVTPAAGEFSLNISAIDQAVPGDYYEFYVVHQIGASQNTVQTNTYGSVARLN